jgi:hypothetical protein
LTLQLLKSLNFVLNLMQLLLSFVLNSQKSMHLLTQAATVLLL